MRHFTKAIKLLARNGWRPRHGLRLFIGLSLVLLLTWAAWIEMAHEALHSDYARASILVLPIMTWLVWVRRSRLRMIEPGGRGVGLIVLAAGLQIYFMGNYVYDLRSVWHMGAVLIVAGTVLVLTGKSLFFQFLPAWAILPLLVPVPSTVALLVARPIQLFEAQAISMLYGLFGVSVELFTGPGTSRLVVGGTTLPMDSVCKGLSTILSLMLISYGFVFGSPMRPLVRAVLLMLAPFVALLCSAMALGGTLWLYDGQSTLVMADLIRELSEWATLLIAFLLIAAALRLMSWASVPVHQYHLASTSP